MKRYLLVILLSLSCGISLEVHSQVPHKNLGAKADRASKNAQRVLTQKVEAEIKRREAAAKRQQESQQFRQQQINANVQQNQQAAGQLSQVHAEQFLQAPSTLENAGTGQWNSNKKETQQRAANRAAAMKNGKVVQRTPYTNPQKNILEQNRSVHNPWNPSIKTFRPIQRQRLPQGKPSAQRISGKRNPAGIRPNAATTQTRQMAPQDYRQRYERFQKMMAEAQRRQELESSYPPPPPSQIPVGGPTPVMQPGPTTSDDFNPVKIITRKDRDFNKMMNEFFPEKKKDARYEEWLRSHDKVVSTLPRCNAKTRQCWIVNPQSSSNGWTRTR